MVDEGSRDPPTALVDHSSCTPDQREQVLDALTAQANAVHAEVLRMVAAADDAEDHKADGTHSMADWLAYRLGVCWHHHLLHDGGWNATGNADDEITLTSQLGRTVRSRAGSVAA